MSRAERQSLVGSRPSLTDSVTPEIAGDEASTVGGGSDGSEIDEKLAEAQRRVRRSDLANRPISVHPDRKLREEAVREKPNGGFRGRTVAEVAKQFLKWYREQEGSRIVFENGDGAEVKADLPTSYSEGYAKRQYGKMKDIERAFAELARNPQTVMLTLTQSNENQNGDYRAPADHLRELQESWSETVYHSLRNEMRKRGYERFEAPNMLPAEEVGPSHLPAKWWEYMVVLEPHESGYMHAHVAVFLDAGPDGEIDPEAFQPVLENHVSHVSGAGPEAHTVENAVSVNDVGEGGVENLGSYISEYIAGFEDPLESSPEELAGYAAVWSTGSQRVRFSEGANELAEIGQRLRGKEPETPSSEWVVKHIERPDGETHPPAEVGGGPEFKRIDGAPSMDPPKDLPPD